MSHDEGLYAWVQEALEPLGPVTMRKMMGAATLYLDGIIFAVLDESELWFKADAETDAIWDADGCERFTFTGKDGKVETMNYRRAPSRRLRRCRGDAALGGAGPVEAGHRAPRSTEEAQGRRPKR